MATPPTDPELPGAPAPAEPLFDQPLLDEEGLDEEELDALQPPPGDRPAAVRQGQPQDEGTAEEEVEESGAERDAARLLDALQADREAPEEDLTEGDAPGPTLSDEAQLSPAWLDEDGLAPEEEALVPPRTPPLGARLLVGLEEHVELVDLGGLRVVASMATGVRGSVLSASLGRPTGDKVVLHLGEGSFEVDPTGFSTRVRLGGRLITLRLRVVHGPSPQLVLGTEVLAGRFVVDPDARFLLDMPAADREP